MDFFSLYVYAMHINKKVMVLVLNIKIYCIWLIEQQLYCPCTAPKQGSLAHIYCTHVMDVCSFLCVDIGDK